MYRFVDKTRTMVAHEESRATLAWNPITNKLADDHGFAAEDFRRAASPQPLPPLAPKMPDDADRSRRRSAGDDARRRV